MSDSKPKLAANFKNRHNTRPPETPLSKYEKAVDEYKGLLEDKVHPDNRTTGYKKHCLSIFNRLMVAADNLDAEDPGAGVFGLIILALRTNLALKDKNLKLEVRIRDLERRMKRLEKR